MSLVVVPDLDVRSRATATLTAAEDAAVRHIGKVLGRRTERGGVLADIGDGIIEGNAVDREAADRLGATDHVDGKVGSRVRVDVFLSQHPERRVERKEQRNAITALLKVWIRGPHGGVFHRGQNGYVVAKKPGCRFPAHSQNLGYLVVCQGEGTAHRLSGTGWKSVR